MAFLADRGRILLALDPREREVLRDLFAQVVELVESEPDDGADTADPTGAAALAEMVGIGTATHAPLDPALARLLPDAYDDAIASGDFRRYTETRLRRRKVENALEAISSLEQDSPVELDERAVAGWMGALNDVRLVIGVRLGVTEEDDVQEWLAGPDAGLYVVYHWLGDLQGDLLEALDALPG